jgi:hypothetical protein
LKTSLAHAFTMKSLEVEMEHLMQAILLVEESGNAFQSILNREKTHATARYIAKRGRCDLC